VGASAAGAGTTAVVGGAAGPPTTVDDAGAGGDGGADRSFAAGQRQVVEAVVLDADRPVAPDPTADLVALASAADAQATATVGVAERDALAAHERHVTAATDGPRPELGEWREATHRRGYTRISITATPSTEAMRRVSTAGRGLVDGAARDRGKL
jgi:hypothetical protein